GTPIHSQISSAFARITQAYETLASPQSRATYDASLKRSKSFESSSSPMAAHNKTSSPVEDVDYDVGTPGIGQAEHSFNEGLGALKQGRINAAVAHLAAASRLIPQDARYRAHYGRALAATEKTRRLAENEIKAAVTLDPNNAAYRVMLAELYFDLKFHRRAQSEADRALAIEPNNAQAHTLLRKLEDGKHR
ncbi:MAG TPA: tetratricopeptide repeat protein, partial [Pyrinomonadaceae bacterium]|nr:tetratricopeptide repeat protein [Pyrinomonadaceae bacterium]